MEKINELKYLLLILVSLSSASCKNSGPVSEVQNPTTTEKPDPQQPEEKIFLPVKIVYDRLTTDFEYVPETRLLKEIRKSTGYRYVFSYNPEKLLIEYEIYLDDKLLYFAQFARDTNGLITKIVRFDVEQDFHHTFIPRGYFTVTYNAQNQLQMIQTYGNNKKLTEEKTFRYTDVGTLSEIIYHDDISSYTINCTYDLKNGIYKNISNGSLISVVHDNIDFITPMNNMLDYTSIQTPTENKSVSYEYNAENYPSKMIVTRKSLKETHLINYIEFDPD